VGGIRIPFKTSQSHTVCPPGTITSEFSPVVLPFRALNSPSLYNLSASLFRRCYCLLVLVPPSFWGGEVYFFIYIYWKVSNFSFSPFVSSRIGFKTGEPKRSSKNDRRKCKRGRYSHRPADGEQPSLLHPLPQVLYCYQPAPPPPAVATTFPADGTMIAPKPPRRAKSFADIPSTPARFAEKHGEGASPYSSPSEASYASLARSLAIAAAAAAQADSVGGFQENSHEIPSQSQPQSQLPGYAHASVHSGWDGESMADIPVLGLWLQHRFFNNIHSDAGRSVGGPVRV
jgi:hypothetical protein